MRDLTYLGSGSTTQVSGRVGYPLGTALRLAHLPAFPQPKFKPVWRAHGWAGKSGTRV